MSQLSRGLRRRATALTAGAAVLALALAACSGGDAAKNPTATAGPQEVTFLTHWGPEQVTQLEAAAAAFKKLEPNITVKVQAVPFANLLSTLRTQGASANGPTIASIYSLWLPELVRDSIAAKAPADVATNLKASWPQNLVDAVSSNGTAYGIPNEVDLYELNYNTKLFAAAGISSPPATFSELVADAKKLTNKAQGRQGFGVPVPVAGGIQWRINAGCGRHESRSHLAPSHGRGGPLCAARQRRFDCSDDERRQRQHHRSVPR
jgi:multiple sugar transport system substrate-binding protein